MKTLILSERNIEEVTDVLCKAFYNYPVMKYVLGEKEDYNKRQRQLVKYFVLARVFRNEPMFGIYNSDNKMVASAIVTLPGDISHPIKLIEQRDKLWTEPGSVEKKRYKKYGNVASGLLPQKPHHHLNMIGVRNAYQGKGFARQLINAVEELVSQHPTSTGVSLNTEVESNVNLYLHLGYELVGYAKVDEGIDSRGFFKLMK